MLHGVSAAAWHAAGASGLPCRPDRYPCHIESSELLMTHTPHDHLARRRRRRAHFPLALGGCESAAEARHPGRRHTHRRHPPIVLPAKAPPCFGAATIRTRASCWRRSRAAPSPGHARRPGRRKTRSTCIGRRRPQRARTLGMLLIPLDAGYTIALRRAPEVRQACIEAWGPPEEGPSVVSLRELLG